MYFRKRLVLTLKVWQRLESFYSNKKVYTQEGWESPWADTLRVKRRSKFFQGEGGMLKIRPTVYREGKDVAMPGAVTRPLSPSGDVTSPITEGSGPNDIGYKHRIRKLCAIWKMQRASYRRLEFFIGVTPNSMSSAT